MWNLILYMCNIFISSQPPICIHIDLLEHFSNQLRENKIRSLGFCAILRIVSLCPALVNYKEIIRPLQHLCVIAVHHSNNNKWRWVASYIFELVYLTGLKVSSSYVGVRELFFGEFSTISFSINDLENCFEESGGTVFPAIYSVWSYELVLYF